MPNASAAAVPVNKASVLGGEEKEKEVLERQLTHSPSSASFPLLALFVLVHRILFPPLPPPPHA